MRAEAAGTCSGLFLSCIYFKSLIFNGNVGPILDAQPLTAHTLLSVTDSYVLGHALVRGEVGERDHQMFVLTFNHVSRSCSLF